MKIGTNVAGLARAATLARDAVDLKETKRFVAVGGAQIRATETSATLTLNNLNFQITHAFAADVAAPGKLAVGAEAFAALMSALPRDTEVSIELDDNVALIKSGRRRFRLPVIPQSQLPVDLQIDTETGKAVLPRIGVHALFAKTSFATVTPKDQRAYLRGTFLCSDSTNGTLTAVTTDGHKLALYSVTSLDVLSDDRRLIVPAPAAEMAVRILADKSLDTVTLRRSRTLFAIEGVNVQFTSRLLDADFPRYEAVLAAPAEGATVERVALRSALARARAVSGAREAQLTWTDNELRLTVTDASDDLIDAKVVAPGAIMIDGRKLSEIVEELDGPHVGLSAGALGTPLRITTDDPRFLAILAPRITSEAQP